VLYFGDVSDKKRDDVIKTGDKFHETKSSGNKILNLGCMCRSLLLFRGALMNKEWIEDWREEVA